MTFKIKEDTYEFKTDKRAHLGISFGLFYFFLTYIHSIPLSICLSLLVGLSYEIYQGIFTTGYSHHDMLYNVMGIILSSSIHILYLSI